MIAILCFLLGLMLGIVITGSVLAKVLGWADSIVKAERRLFTNDNKKEKIELL